jgi:C1A family cysteine protease
MRRTFRISALFLGLSLATALAEDFAPETKIDSLTAGTTTYRQVQVRSVNARTVMITHSGGMASVRLRDLSPEWQARFHYDPAREHAAELAAKSPAPAAGHPAVRPAPDNTSKLEALLQRFGQPAAVQAEVDLRPKFFQLELGVKNQGRRPSCAVFAIVSALEFQSAEAAGRVEKFSEEYLSWAVRKTVQRLPVAGNMGADAATEAKDDTDDGFALSEVVAALRAYGIPRQSSMPNTFGSRIGAIEEPPAAIIAEARTHQKVFVHLLPGRDAPTRLNNLVQALNAGVPVAVGMAWPNYRSIHNGYLSGQRPMANSGHAVTLVGYKSATGRIEDAVFIFKNSWGADWGQGGYGTVTYGYLLNYLNDAVVLEVQAARAT